MPHGRRGFQRGGAPMARWGFFSNVCIALRKSPNELWLFSKPSGGCAATSCSLCLSSSAALSAVAFFPLPVSLAAVAPVLTFYPAGSRSDRCTLRICAMRPVCVARTLFATPERPRFPPCRCQGNNGCFHNRPTVGLLWKGRKSSSVRCSPVRQVRDGRDTFPAAG